MTFLKLLAIHSLWGVPVVAYFGAATLLLMLSAATVALTARYGWLKSHYRVHVALALSAIVIAVFHGLLAAAFLFF